MTKHKPIPELDLAAGQMILAEARGEKSARSIERLFPMARALGLQTDPAYVAAHYALKRARKRHSAAPHALAHLAGCGRMVDEAMDNLLSKVAEFEAAANAIEASLGDDLDLSPFSKAIWFPLLQGRLVGSGGRLGAWVPDYEAIRDRKRASPASVQGDKGLSQ